MIATIKSTWNKIPVNVRHILHTSWQAALGALLVGLVNVHSTVDMKALLFTIYTTGFAALKAAALSMLVGKA